VADVSMSVISEPVEATCPGAPSPSTVLCTRGGARIPLLVDRWAAVPAAEEMAVLDRALGPVLDVGCGPGRHVYELAARGVVALGVDISDAAVACARERGSSVLQRSVFDRLPNEGRWRTALLMDGNVGIGGDAVGLLHRLRSLITALGSVLVEVEGPDAPTTVEIVRVEREGETGPWFPWARVSVDGIDDIAAAAGFRRTWTHEEEHRWFAELTR
jgi:SAM-dependent methyltransferase